MRVGRNEMNEIGISPKEVDSETQLRPSPGLTQNRIGYLQESLALHTGRKGFQSRSLRCSKGEKSQW
jgi:hypothetical protein